jgi:hypothetical protein
LPAVPDVPGVPSAEELAGLPQAELAVLLAEAYRVIAEQAALIGQLQARVEHLERRAGRDDLLTELRSVSAAQVGCPLQESIAEMSERSGLPGHCSLVASLIPIETGHTGRNQSPAFSSLPIFDVSRRRALRALQYP